MLQAAAMQGPELRDIHLPAPPSWWPPAPGWWLLALLVLGVCAYLLLHWRRRSRRVRRRRQVMAEFENAVAAVRGDAPALATALSIFLRRLALRTAPAAATLKGDAWLRYLDAKLGNDEFSQGVGRALVDAPWRAHADFDTAALTALVRRTVVKICTSEAAHV